MHYPWGVLYTGVVRFVLYTDFLVYWPRIRGVSPWYDIIIGTRGRRLPSQTMEHISWKDCITICLFGDLIDAISPSEIEGRPWLGIHEMLI